MATFTITTNEKINLPPYQTGILYLNVDNSADYTFTVDDFTINTVPIYADPEGDDLLKIKITSIEADNLGGLYLDNTLVGENEEITVIQIANGDLVYKTNLAQEATYIDLFTFDVADVGSEEYNNLEGAINVSVNAVENQPPSAVGDGEATIEHGETLVFTRAMFTTATTPPYSDPEGDAALLLQITSLPTNGVIYLAGVTDSLTAPVIENQIITFSDIDLGRLFYEPDSGIIEGDIEGFTFGIADAGSGIFVY